MPAEIETKFLDVDHDALRRRLQALGGHFEGCVFEDNQVWDTPGKILKDRGDLLRLRQDDCIRLTFKQPKANTGHLKIVDEHEVVVDNLAAMGGILAGLGYEIAFRYQKLRETWGLDEVHCCMDTLPFGQFLELEGTGEAIAKVAAALGLDLRQGSDATYHALHMQRAAEKGLPTADSFVFSVEEAQQLQRQAAVIRRENAI